MTAISYTIGALLVAACAWAIAHDAAATWRALRSSWTRRAQR